LASTVSPYVPPIAQFTVEVVHERDAVVIAPRGELDLATVDALDASVRDARAAGAADIVIDLRGLTFVDSSGLRLLLQLRNDARRTARRLRLVPGSDEVQRLFALTRTRTLFEWRPED
jgi:anti-anti-sigma factor